MENHKNKQGMDSEQWSQYWKQANLTSFQRESEGNYDREFAEFWQRQWAQCPNEGRIVDLATGNGAVALLAANYARERKKNFYIVGIDSADIAPVKNLGAPKSVTSSLEYIKFIGNIKIECTGMDDGSADLLCSQYGLEYSNTLQTARECARIIKPGGILALILHHHGSVIAQQSRDAIGIIKLFEKESFYEQVCKLLKEVDLLGNTPSSARARQSQLCENLRLELNASIKRLNEADKDFTDTFMLDYGIPQFMRAFSPKAGATFEMRLAALEQVQSEMIAFRMRMDDLLSATLGEEELDHLIKTFSGNGFKVNSKERFYYDKNQLMGWQVEAIKP